MAHMPETAPKSHSNSRFRPAGSRSSSALGYATATSFKDAIHSTPQLENTTSQEHIPIPSLDHHFAESVRSERSDLGSADMSIEIGRGYSRAARDQSHDFSSNPAFGFGIGDSQYELTGTPPVRTRAISTRDALPLHREASLRRAAGQTAVNGKLRRAVSSNPASSLPTRFTADQGLHSSQRPTAFANTAIQSTTYTANHSFILPDMPDISELVSGVRKDGTPLTKRVSASRSRFTSASYKPQARGHRSVSAVAVPDDERAIFASLQLMKDKVSQLETEKSEAQIQAEEREDHIINLQTQLRYAGERPDSALGSDDDTMGQTKTRLLASAEASRERLKQHERKLSIAKKTLEDVREQRDALITQVSTAYIDNERLLEENDVLRDSCERLQSEKDDLKRDLEDLRASARHVEPSRSKRRSFQETGAVPGDEDTRQHVKVDSRDVRSKKESKNAKPDVDAAGGMARERVEQHATMDISSKIEQEIERQRHEGMASNVAKRSREQGPVQGARSERSRSESRRQRHVSAPLELEQETSDAESTTDLAPLKDPRRHSQTTHTDMRDITYLSDIDVNEVARLRRKLEEELRTKRSKKNASKQDEGKTTHSSSNDDGMLPIQPSNGTALFDQGTGRISLRANDTDNGVKLAKTVRVQSPHSSDNTSPPEHLNVELVRASVTSNISRRRQRSASTDGETSAFIIPDITVHRTHSLPTDLGLSCIEHKSTECTVCAQNGGNLTVPMPVPVSDRDGLADLTDATIRPSQPPATALATVLKHLEDELKHLKIERERFNRMYNKHDPALSRRKRMNVKSEIDRLTANIERRSDHVYALYDVLEGQKAQAKAAGVEPNDMGDVENENTLSSIGIDPAELSGRLGRGATTGLDGVDDLSDELPWEGLSDIDSEEEVLDLRRDKRRSAAI